MTTISFHSRQASNIVLQVPEKKPRPRLITRQIYVAIKIEPPVNFQLKRNEWLQVEINR